MHLRPRLTLVLGAAVALAACGDNGNTDSSTSTSLPATSTGEPDPTTGTPTTTGSESSSSGGMPAHSCLAIKDEPGCLADPLCEWKGVVQYTHGAQGCAGSITQFCIEKMPSGGPSAWYLGEGKEAQVVEFQYTPPDLGPEWTACSCDGPLACLCTSVSPECPDRYEEFCGAIVTEIGCAGASFKEIKACAWATISPEGPPDMDCSDSAQTSVCLPATDADKDMCTPPAYTFGNCAGFGQDIFWREVAGEIEITTLCGPAPVGWTRCEGDDTPEQPDECKCRCL
jgi:hypothetical protein